MKILFEDNHLLVVEKPKGVLTQPSGTSQESLEYHAKTWLKEKYRKQGNVFLEAIHRLDRPVSGIVLFAKTSKALSRLQEEMRKKRWLKIYHALVEGTIPNPEGILEHYLVHDDHKAIVSKEGKLARLSYSTLEVFPEGTTLLAIELETGRYHQIRAQLSHIGCPIVGDVKYGSKIPYMGEGIALHHTHMQIAHPVTKEILTFNSSYV